MVVNTSKKQLDKTISYNAYVDRDILAEEKQKIFYKDWIYVGHASQVENIGDFFTFDLAGEPLIISRDRTNELNAFFNICPHRGTRVEKGTEGNKKLFMCTYHGWTFHLDGKVNRTPNFNKDEVDEQRHCLTHVKLEIYKSMIFVNLDENAPSLQESYASWIEDLNKYDFLDSLKKVKVEERIVHANWKAIIDNYLECDHCQINHPGFAKTLDLKNYNTDLHDKYTCQYSGLKRAESDNEEQANFYWVWPNTMISIYPGESGNITTSQIIPISPEKSRAIYTYYFQSEDLTDEQNDLIEFVDQVREEDFVLVELLQSGLHSQAFDSGIYSPTEHAIKHFHDIYTKKMNKR